MTRRRIHDPNWLASFIPLDFHEPASAVTEQNHRAEFTDADGCRWRFQFDVNRNIGLLSGDETDGEAVEIVDGYLAKDFDLLSREVHNWLAEQMAAVGRRLNSTCFVTWMDESLKRFAALSPEQQEEAVHCMEQFREAMRAEADSDEGDDDDLDDGEWDSLN